VDQPHGANVADEFDTAVKKIRGDPVATPPTGRLRDLERRYSIIQTLLHVSASITSVLNLEEVLSKSVDAVIEITGSKRGLLMLRNEGTGELVRVLARSQDGQTMPPESFELSASAIRRAVEEGEPVFVHDTGEDAALKDQKSILNLHILTVICIPLKFEDNLLGVIYSDSDSVSERFAASDISLLKSFGAQAAVAIGHARRHGELESFSQSLEMQNVSLREELAERYVFSGMIGRSRSMQQIFEVVRKVASLSTTVLIQGETGTGKELIAKAIHYNGARKTKPIVTINCGALPKDILESELFGYRRAAFTGAEQDRAGLFEAANQGTIFLDEIGEMPMDLQVKLLRALQDGEVRRVGEDFSRKVDVRVISATNRDLAAEVEAGNFRRDLYYRLNVVPIFIPPLRERQEDILPLADFFLAKFAEEMKRPKPMLAREAKERLLQYEWLGNVRELENAIERAIALGEGKVVLEPAQFEHLSRRPLVTDYDEAEDSLKETLLACEKEIIRKMLITHSWNVTRTAVALKVSRQQLYSKMRKYKLNPLI
jgi:Nif-specific regulatory protein